MPKPAGSLDELTRQKIRCQRGEITEVQFAQWIYDHEWPEDNWIAPWHCPWTGRQDFTFAPDFSGLDPDTGEAWSPRKVVKLLGLSVMRPLQVRRICEGVLARHPDKAAAYRAGKQQLVGFFVKAVMDETQKKADPKAASRLLTRLLQRTPRG